MKFTEIKNKTDKELGTMLSEKHLALRDFRFGSAGSASKNVKAGRGLKKDIARILTALNTNKIK